MLGRDGHPAFGIEIDCGCALKHVLPFGLKEEWSELYKNVVHVAQVRERGISPTKRHFFTLLPTLVDATIVVKRFTFNRNPVFCNEVKDLASFLEAG